MYKNAKTMFVVFLPTFKTFRSFKQKPQTQIKNVAPSASYLWTSSTSVRQFV